MACFYCRDSRAAGGLSDMPTWIDTSCIVKVTILIAEPAEPRTPTAERRADRHVDEETTDHGESFWWVKREAVRPKVEGQ
jgi:hypothetical protein